MIKLVYITESEIEHKNYPPLSLMYLASYLKKKGFATEICHGPLDKLSIQDISADSLFIGISVMPGKHVKLCIELSKKLKQANPEAKIIWGGIYPTMETEKCLKEDYIDIVARGEGEQTILDIAEALKEKKELHGVEGISFKSGNSIIRNKDRDFIELVDYASIYESIDLSNYIIHLANGKRALSVITSRGCPFPCGFCYNVTFNKKRWRGYSTEKVIKVINTLAKKYKLDGIIFDDDYFFVDQERAFNILEGISIPSYYLEIRANIITEKFMERLMKTKPNWIFLGLESGNDRVLNLMRKGFKVKDIENAIKIISKYQINLKASFVMGYPKETWEELRDTLRLAIKVFDTHKRTAFMFCPFIPLPNTPGYELAKAEGFKEPKTIEDQDIDMLSTNLYWLNYSKDRRNKLKLITSYGKLLDSSYLDGHPFYFKLIKGIFSFFAYHRIKHLFFLIPFEPALYLFMERTYARVLK